MFVGASSSSLSFIHLQNTLCVKMLVIVLASFLGFVTAVDEFIVGGQDADINAFPWQGSLMNSGSHSCGCVLLAPSWILTAAHCVADNPDPTIYTTGWGDSDRTKLTTYSVESVIIHEDYNGTAGFEHDIAILRSAAPVSGGVEGPIDLALSSSPPTNPSQCNITGWGQTCGIPIACQIPTNLQGTGTTVIPDDDCSAAHGDTFDRTFMICVKRAEADAGACNGDSGGPLTCKDGDTSLLYGVTSWGRSGCSTDYPSVYTRVGFYRRWICENTDKEIACD